MKAILKGTGPVDAAFAIGGPGDTSRSRFMKVPDPFRTDIEKQDYAKTGKGGELSEMSGDTKSKQPIKPRS
jgi:hypothetical protein